MNQNLMVIVGVALLAVGGAVFLLMNNSGGDMAANNNQTVSPMQETADAHFQASEWEEAVAAYEQVVVDEPNNSQAWFQMASSLRSLERWNEAAVAFEKAHELEFNPLFTGINLARMYGQIGELDQAFEAMDGVLSTGFGQVAFLQNDPQLEPMRADARYEQVLETANRNATPCEFDDNNRAFDFWIGEWDVFGPGGNQAGTNTIIKQSNGCMLYENWIGNGGSVGHSINYYDPAKEQWVQHWSDGAGSVIDLYGNLNEDGAMALEGSQSLPDGSVIPMRGTWTLLEDGRVRQLFEQSNDDGQTWFVWFDGYYVKKS